MSKNDIYPNLSSLPRFTISIILSYLQSSHPFDESPVNGKKINTNSLPSLPHNRDALSLLFITRRFINAILPLFRVPTTVARTYRYCTNTNPKNNNDAIVLCLVEKYRFMTLPIQDPKTLLDRLNTRRLRARILWMNHNMKTMQKSDKLNNSGNTISGCSNYQNILSDNIPCYAYGRTTEELAYEEWYMMKIHHSESILTGGNYTYPFEENSCNPWRVWPTHLELLQFLFDHNNERSTDKRDKEVCYGQGQTIPSSIHFNATHNKDHCLTMKHNDGQNMSPNDNVITLLPSYPRSGNTLLRTMFERITSIVTGSDTRPDRTLSRSLALDHDLVGEGLVEKNKQPYHDDDDDDTSSSLTSRYTFDPPVHIVKTHFPERSGWRPVEGNKVILLVRNPYDAIDSYWNLCCTNTHTQTVDETVYAKYAQKFEDLAKHEIQIWCNFHYFWIDICERERVPILIVRYEDLIMDTEGEMRRIMNFVLGTKCDEKTMLNSFWEWRIRHTLSSSSSSSETNGNCSTSNLGSYKPRSSKGGLSRIGKSIRKKRFSEEVLLHMHDVAASLALERKQNHHMYSSASPKQMQQNKKTLLQHFGYDIYNQEFPEKFTRMEDEYSFDVTGKRCGTVIINRSPEIRSKDDTFGRAMTYWRRRETDNDTVPFPTVTRINNI